MADIDIYPTPSVSPFDDYSDYLPLLLGAVDAELNRREVWETGQEDTALSFVRDLIAWIATLDDRIMPTGMIMEYGGATVPAGFLACDGAAVSRTTYARLFAVIGTNFGAGNGTTTFNVPDARGRVKMGTGTGTGLTTRVLGSMFGTEVHTLDLTQIPTHSHDINTSTILAKASGTPGTSNRLLRGTDANTNSNVVNQLAGTTVAQGGGIAHNNTQPSLVVTVCIKT